ncbi:iron complex transport system substrate-binding protein [Paenibacillus phyllosphaerae]|uniref:Iron complex transport system substrate-binding protein n=1 Tax=Paenibacillus phyllosphaerae TaxID=274593 RepID=A0A7W5AZG0_9BACL|nr:iron-siderophore ABC transporter substrate-binding protein [Paenibacillus phyllosphaerae]MBB3111604.1 iron complex transport system substrate-binding protein [Paenibacillus phyllosphaerae]
MSRLRKSSLFIVCAVLLVLVAACGNNGNTSSNSANNAAETNSATTETANNAADSEAAADESRTIKHALGELPITGTPQKIVVLEWTYAEDLLSLGVQPSGVADIENMKKWVSLPAELSADVTDVGTRQEPNLETIAALEPDLIIGVKFRHEATYDQLNAIAPTVLFDPYPAEGQGDQYQEMIATFKTIADVTGKTAEAEAVLADLQKTYDDGKAKLAAAGKEGASIILTMPWVDQNAVTFRVSTDNALAISVLGQLGLKNAFQPKQFEVYGYSEGGVELLQQVPDANYLNITQEDNVIEVLSKNSVWTGLNFVKENRLYPLGGDTWPYGGPNSAKLLAERAVNVLTGAQ